MRRLLTDTTLRRRLAKNARTNYLKDFQFDKIIENQYIPLYEGKQASGIKSNSL
jgi:hypothetical protein